MNRIAKCFYTSALTYACVLKPGENMVSDRVIDEIGAMALAALHYWWESINIMEIQVVSLKVVRILG